MLQHSTLTSIDEGDMYHSKWYLGWSRFKTEAAISNDYPISMQWSIEYLFLTATAAVGGLRIDAAMVVIGTCGSVGWQAGRFMAAIDPTKRGKKAKFDVYPESII